MKRNLFDLDNARYLNKKELVETFIPTTSFEKILAPKNQIIIGSRGSGKTALLKMAAHDHLSLLDNPTARDIINSKLYIGTHISTKTKFISGLKNKNWQDDIEKEYHFRWLMNLASCIALLETIKSCLNTYYPDKNERLEKEVEIITKLSLYWLPENERVYTIHDLEEQLESITFLKSQNLLERKIYGDLSNKKQIGLTFDLELFDPILSAIAIVNRKLDFPEHTTWFICIDEIEILEEFHHRILNSYMRSNSGNVFFKFTTLPYCHYTLETNTNVPLEIRHDVHYVYIDQDPSFQYRATKTGNSALELFEKRARISKPEFAEYDLHQLFGSSLLLDRFNIVIPEGQIETTSDELIAKDPILILFNKYAGEPTKSRGLNLLENREIERFGNEFGRKMRGLLILREEYERTRRGNHTVTLYSGAKIIVNVGDANPRKLLGIFNEMLKTFESSRSYLKEQENKIIYATSLKKYSAQYNRKVKNKREYSSENPMIPYSIQNFVLASLAERELSKSRIEKNIGNGLYEFITLIGEFMKSYIHENPLTTEQISSIDIPGTIDNNTWEIVKRAVQKGLLYPNRNVHNPDEMPYKEGTFRLGYILAPKFILLPRKGDARSLLTILPSQLKFEFDA